MGPSPFSDRLSWTFLAATARRLAQRHKSLTSDTVRLSPAPVVTANTLMDARPKKRWKVRGREENKKWTVRTNQTTRDGDDAPRGDTVLPPPPYTKGKWGVRIRLNAKLSADAASTEGQPHLFCTATWRSEEKIRRLGGRWRGAGGMKDEQASSGEREGWFSSGPFFTHTQLKQRTCKRLSDRCSLWMCWIRNDALSAGWCLLQGGILSPV